MKPNLKKATLLLSGLAIGSQLFAQTPDSTHMKKSMSMNNDYVKPFSSGQSFRHWSIGVDGGMLSPYTFLSPGTQDFNTPHEKIGYGGYINYQVLPAFGLQADYLRGNVEGKNPNTNYSYGTPDFTQFTTKFNYAVSLSANITLANINWRREATGIRPYISIGGGEIGYTPRTFDAGTNTSTTLSSEHDFFIPVGAGLKLGLTRGVDLNLGYQINFVNNDGFDGFVAGNNNDRFSYAHVGLEFALGNKSKPALSHNNPVANMRTEYLMDEMRLQTQVDAANAANAALQSNLATTNANLAKLTVDSDGDGVPDVYDKCPNTPAGTAVDGSGCPLPVAKPDVKVYVTQEDRAVVNEAVKNLEFDFGKATIAAHSDTSLNKLATLLVNKKFSLKLAGYTDNVGSAEANQKLSQARADAVKTYLETQGVSPDKIQAVGYGKAHPIATNKTDKGRALNRRVEFSIY